MPASAAAPTLPSGDRDWLALGAASRLLGVDPDTLRRWADEGRVAAFATPGGHRRFARHDLERLVATRRTGPQGALAGLGATPDRLSAAYRRRYGARARAGGPDPRASVPATDHAVYREHGRRLVAALVRHLDAGAAPDRAAAEQEALALTADLGVRLASAGVPLEDAIALFVAARRPFLAELGVIARRRDLDSARLSALYDAATQVLDRLLLRLVASHGATMPTSAEAVVPSRVARRTAPATARPGIRGHEAHR